MSMSDLIPILLATRMESQRVNVPLSEDERKARYRQHNKKRDVWRAMRRAKGLPVT